MTSTGPAKRYHFRGSIGTSVIYISARSLALSLSTPHTWAYRYADVLVVCQQTRPSNARPIVYEKPGEASIPFLFEFPRYCFLSRRHTVRERSSLLGDLGEPFRGRIRTGRCSQAANPTPTGRAEATSTMLPWGIVG